MRSVRRRARTGSVPAPPVNHYAVLGVAADADLRTIQRAFRALARDAHPDVGGDAEVFRRLRDAYEVLTDPARRREHDDDLGIRRGGPVGTADAGWSGRQGAFTGDVEFPAYLRDVVEAPWQPGVEGQARPSGAEPAPSSSPVPADVAWWWPHGATVRPLRAGPLAVLVAGSAVSGVDATSGLDAWRTELGAVVEARPVLVDGAVVTGLAGGSVEALDLGTGRSRWQHHLGAPLTAELAGWPGRLAAGVGAAVVALDVADGRRCWATKVAGPPVSLTVAGEHLVVATARGTLHGLDLARGRQRWWVRAAPAVDPPPCTVGDAVWLTAGSGRLARLTASTGAVHVTIAPGSAVAGLASMGSRLLASVAGPARLVALASDGSTWWSTELGAVSPEPAVVGGLVVVAEPTGDLVWIDGRDGGRRGVVGLPFEPSGPPVAVAGRVLVSDRGGTVWAIAPPTALAG